MFRSAGVGADQNVAAIAAGSSSTGDNEVLKVAVVGYGYWGSKHVRVLSNMPGVQLVVVDSDSERVAEAGQTYPGAEVAQRLDDVLDAVHAVVVATPPRSHTDIAVRALRAGRHVLVEKPLATSVTDAQQMIDAASDSGAFLMVGHTFEYNPAVWKLKEIIDSGELGKILYIDTARLGLGAYQNDCNVVWDLAPHDISIVSFLLDEMPSATSVWAQRHLGHWHADVAYLRLDFERAATQAYVHVSWLDPCKVRRVTVVGERKMAVYNDMSDNERVRVYDIGVDRADPDDHATPHAMPVTYRTGDIVSPYVNFKEPLLVQDSHFVECIRTGTHPLTPGERGQDVVRVLSAADAAHASGRTAPVEWPAERETASLPRATPVLAHGVAS